MRVLVTGATGYVGSRVVPALLGAGHDVRALTRSTTSDPAAVLLAAGAELAEGSLADPAGLAEAVEGVDAIAHLAFDDTAPEQTDARLLDAIEAIPAARRPHLVYTTGCSVYGEHQHARIDLATPLDPTTVRARLEQQLAERDIAATVLRPGMVFGADARTSIVGDWFAQAADGGPVALPGRQDKVWSWVHVLDVAAAFVRVVADPASHVGRAYLLADDAPTRPREVVDAVAGLAGVASRPAPIEDELPAYRVFDRDEIIDASAARRELGWAPQQPAILVDLATSRVEWSRR